MMMRVIDVAPNEAPLVALTDGLEEVIERGESLSEEEIKSFDRMNPGVLETARLALRLVD
jgi:hypothetical protein